MRTLKTIGILNTTLLLILASCQKRPDGDSGNETSDGITLDDSSGDDENSSGDGDGDGDSTDTSGDGDGDSTDTSGDGDDIIPCEDFDVTLEVPPPDVVLVLDKSGSMWTNNIAPGVTRWNGLYGVVETTVTQYDQSILFGSKLFPNKGVSGNGSCTTSATLTTNIQLDAADSILMALPAQNSVSTDPDAKGATPTAFGLTAAVDALIASNNEAGAFIILVTDGAANCNKTAVETNAPFYERFETYDDVTNVVQDAYLNNGIPTFVVGIGIQDHTPSKTSCGVFGSDPTCNLAAGETCAQYNGGALECNWAPGNPKDINPYEKLNEVADVGGVPKTPSDPLDGSFYNAENLSELQDALASIAGGIPSCVVPLDPPPDANQVHKVEVRIPPMTMRLTYHQGVYVCDGLSDGWVYTDTSYTAIELCGASCDELKDVGTVDVKYPCFVG